MTTTAKCVLTGLVLVWLAIILAMLSLNGCATITAGDFSYTRVGNQHIEGRVVTPEGWIIELNQNSKTEVMEQALKILGYVAK